MKETTQKIVEKLRPGKSRDAIDEDEVSQTRDSPQIKREKPHDHPKHPKIEGVVESAVHAGIREWLDAFSESGTYAVLSNFIQAEVKTGTNAAMRTALSVVDGDFGKDVVGRLTSAQAEVFAKTSQTPLARQAARIGAKDAILGSYDAMEEKYMEWLKGDTVSRKYIAPLAIAAFVVAVVPLTLSLWRFALFGLH